MVNYGGDDMAAVDDWILAYELNCSVMADVDDLSSPALAGPEANREYGYVIDTSTMEILWRGFGSTAGQAQVDSSAVQGLVHMCIALGLGDCPEPLDP